MVGPLRNFPGVTPPLEQKSHIAPAASDSKVFAGFKMAALCLSVLCTLGVVLFSSSVKSSFEHNWKVCTGNPSPVDQKTGEVCKKALSPENTLDKVTKAKIPLLEKRCDEVAEKAEKIIKRSKEEHDEKYSSNFPGHRGRNHIFRDVRLENDLSIFPGKIKNEKDLNHLSGLLDGISAQCTKVELAYVNKNEDEEKYNNEEKKLHRLIRDFKGAKP